MVKAQEWLDKKYPNKEERSKITKLNDGGVYNIFDAMKKIEGYLDLSDFINLEEIRFSERGQLTGLDVSNCTKLVKLNCSQNLISNLNLNKNVMLAELYCSDNQLRELDTTNCPNLKIIRCDNNLLTSLDLSANRKLEFLSVKDNNFAKQDLSFLAHLTNLKVLELGNDNSRRIKKGLYNQFFGSLESLKELSKLEKLNINNTDLSDGLEYLSNNVSLYCSWEKRPNSQVKKIEEQTFSISSVQVWKEGDKSSSISTSRTVDDQSTVSSFRTSSQQQEEDDLIDRTKEEKLTTKDLLEQIKQLQEENSQLKLDNTRLEKELAWFKLRDLEQNFRIKETELDKLIASVKSELNEKGQKSLNKLLEAQKELLENDIPYVQKQFEKAKNKLSKHLTEEIIKSLCDKQIKLIKLEKHLTSLQQDQEQVAQILQLTSQPYGIPSSSKGE